MPRILLFNISSFQLIALNYCRFLLDAIIEAKFVKRMLKLNKVLQHCEKVKKLQPLFSLHIGELIHFFN